MTLATIRLRLETAPRLCTYVATQLNSTFPDAGIDADVQRLMPVLGTALERMRPMLSAVRAFQPDAFDHLHSLQYCAFLYLLSNEYRRVSTDDGVADRLFGLNRMLNAIDLYHGITLPEVFFISHGLGAVLGNAQYQPRLVVFQNVTVGRVGDDRPALGRDVTLYAGATLTGRTRVGDRCAIGAGVVLHNATVPDDSVAFGSGDGVTIRPRHKDYAALYFRPA